MRWCGSKSASLLAAAAAAALAAPAATQASPAKPCPPPPAAVIHAALPGSMPAPRPIPSSDMSATGMAPSSERSECAALWGILPPLVALSEKGERGTKPPWADATMCGAHVPATRCVCAAIVETSAQAVEVEAVAAEMAAAAVAATPKLAGVAAECPPVAASSTLVIANAVAAPARCTCSSPEMRSMAWYSSTLCRYRRALPLVASLSSTLCKRRSNWFLTADSALHSQPGPCKRCCVRGRRVRHGRRVRRGCTLLLHGERAHHRRWRLLAGVPLLGRQ